MLRNLYYLRTLPDEVINELLCCLVVKRYSKGATIIKNGDVATHLSFLRQGEIDIYVSTSLEGQFERDRQTIDSNRPSSAALGEVGVKAKEEEPDDALRGKELLFDTLNTVSE